MKKLMFQRRRSEVQVQRFVNNSHVRYVIRDDFAEYVF